MDVNGRICRKCLLKEMGDAEYARTVEEHIASLPGNIKTPEPEYQNRLAVCRECDRLINGMCALCGCFVELRAAKRVNSCPDSPAKWKGLPTENIS